MRSDWTDTVMRMEAIKQKLPSQMSSAEPQMSRASVYQTAMNAAPRQRQITNPRIAPNQIYTNESQSLEIMRLMIITCRNKRFRRASSSSPTAFLTNERRTDTIIAASRVSETQKVST